MSAPWSGRVLLYYRQKAHMQPGLQTTPWLPSQPLSPLVGWERSRASAFFTTPVLCLPHQVFHVIALQHLEAQPASTPSLSLFFSCNTEERMWRLEARSVLSQTSTQLQTLVQILNLSLLSSDETSSSLMTQMSNIKSNTNLQTFLRWRDFCFQRHLHIHKGLF